VATQCDPVIVDSDTVYRQRLTLLAAILGSAMVLIDGTIVNVALPAIQDDLGGGLSAQQWVSNAYLLALGSLILIGGSLGDIYGERRVFAVGVVAFGVLSACCALAPTIEVLIGVRALQGAAGALVAPSSLAVIVAAFAPRERGAAVGSWTAWGGAAAVVGPLAGGVIVDQTSWRWIFALNVPLGLVTVVLILLAVPQRARVVGRRVDVVGAGLCALGLGGVVFALIEQPHYGWGSPVILVPLLVGALAFAAFLTHERRTAEPMLKLELFSRRNFAVGNAETFAMYAGLGITFFYLVVYLQEVAGYTALESGLTVLPVTVTMFLFSRRFGALADRHGPRLFMGAGPLVAAAGILLLLRVGMHPSYAQDVLPAMLVFAFGLTLTVAPLTATVLADAEEDEAGIASAVNNAVARVAGLLGVSAVGLIVAGTLVGDTFAPNDESVEAFHLVVLICGVLVAAGGILGAVGITNPRRTVDAKQCPGGQLVGAPIPAAEAHPRASGAMVASAATRRDP
jgi:EmrB/QacA subfamily drug resistance transporter